MCSIHMQPQYLQTSNFFYCTCTHSAATWRAMCTTGQELLNRTLSRQAVSGQCNQSKDCLTTHCSLVVSVAFFKIPVELTSTALPCSRPYGIVGHSSGSTLNETIIGTFRETTTITRRAGPLEITVTYEIEQMDKGLLIGVSSDGHYTHRSQHIP